MTGVDYPRSQPTPEALVRMLATGQRPWPVPPDWRNTTNLAELKRMIAAGADVDGETVFKETALKAAAGSGNTAAIDLLLDAGASVNMCGGSYTQYTPLMVAAKGGHTAAVALLLKRGADPDLTSIDGLTAMQLMPFG
jgi:ankyrin repeat protein